MKIIARYAGIALLIGLAAVPAGCVKEGDDGAPGAAGSPAPAAPTRAVLDAAESLPGVVLTVSGLGGSSSPFQVGDTIQVIFTCKKADGTSLPISELNSSAIYVSGPTFNYQRVIPSISNWHTTAAQNADGSYTYTFPSPIPATYAAPYNDTASFGAGDGELTDQPLLAGTYTVGMQAYKNYTVAGAVFRDVANVTYDFLLGDVGEIAPREVVKLENCNQCHVSLRAHGGTRVDVKTCVLCHTAGAEDKNVATVEGGTPGVTVDFRVMIHRIHNGKHLPSVLGVATNADGTRNYAAAPVPCRIIGYQNSVNDFSEVGYPVWPNLNIAMPRDEGYTALTAAQKTQEDEIRRGVTACAKCHGDPDGAGPLASPIQGDVHKTQPTRRACGSCHDDVDWTMSYKANGQTMLAQADDATCKTCHVPAGTQIAVDDAHRHPLTDSAFNPGLNVVVSAVAEAGASDGDGTIDPGEKISVTFSIADDAGGNVTLASAAPTATGAVSLNAVVAGPSNNRNLILYTPVPIGALGATASSYTINLPQRMAFEYLGDATAGADAFATSRTPHWNVAGDLTAVSEGAYTGTATALAAAAGALQNFVDVAATAGFANNDYLILDRGFPTQEVLRIRRVDGARLWFSTRYDTSTSYQPYLRNAHALGAAVERLTLSAVAAANYALTAATGQIAEAGAGFTTGRAVVCTYSTDFVMPAAFPPPLNDSPDLGETWGDWTGKAIADGTYTVGIWGSWTKRLTLFGETNDYRITSPPGNRDFLAASATTLAPATIISSGANCQACHNDLWFHGGGRRGFDTCILCHGTAGSEDWPVYRGTTAGTFLANPASPGLTVEFRNMLHKIHMGKDLANASTYVIYGNNASANDFDEIGFPAMPGGPKECAKCHGASSIAWKEPAGRGHPTQQGLPVRAWRTVCGSCHDSDAAAAHIDVNTATTTSGAESCAACHASGREFNVELMHKSR